LSEAFVAIIAPPGKNRPQTFIVARMASISSLKVPHLSALLAVIVSVAQVNTTQPSSYANCSAANSIVAVGDEDGWIHLLDTENDATSDFTKSHVSFQAHKNAVMDVQFSSDDTFLATASGDQTGQIVDVRTQQCVHVLAKHTSSVKQVRFQPGDDKIVATSSRDGTVQIWDLRCSSGAELVHSVWGENAPYASTVRTLAAAHADSAFFGSYGVVASKNSRYV
jgi:WD40 repeat protein